MGSQHSGGACRDKAKRRLGVTSISYLVSAITGVDFCTARRCFCRRKLRLSGAEVDVVNFVIFWSITFQITIPLQLHQNSFHQELYLYLRDPNCRKKCQRRCLIVSKLSLNSIQCRHLPAVCLRKTVDCQKLVCPFEPRFRGPGVKMSNGLQKRK